MVRHRGDESEYRASYINKKSDRNRCKSDDQSRHDYFPRKQQYIENSDKEIGYIKTEGRQPAFARAVFGGFFGGGVVRVAILLGYKRWIAEPCAYFLLGVAVGKLESKVLIIFGDYILNIAYMLVFKMSFEGVDKFFLCYFYSSNNFLADSANERYSLRSVSKVSAPSSVRE